MKKIANILIATAVALAGTSCSGFLEETSRDLVVPRTVEHYRAMLNAEGYLTLVDYYLSDLMTDDVTEVSSATTLYKNDWKSIYTWQRDLELDGNNKQNAASLNFAWVNNYKLIAVLNYIIEEIEQAEGDQADRIYMKGESYCLRAKCYLHMVNLYAAHYNPATAATDLGVPLRLDIAVKDTYVRNSVAECYQAIEQDFMTGIALMEESGIKRNVWSMSPLAAKLLLSRMYLYMGEEQKCIDMAGEVIAARDRIMWDLSRNSSNTFVSYPNTEIVHTWGPTNDVTVSANYPRAYYNAGVMFKASQELTDLFPTGDARRESYLKRGDEIPAKVTPDFTKLGAFTLRKAEAFLNRAEAYSSLGMDAEALADVTEVVKSRVSNLAAVTIPTSGEALRDFIRDERRREFCFEGMRWIDLKRWTDARRNIVHVYSTATTSGAVTGTETYTLLANDPNYILPIPNAEIEGNNELLIQNDRYEKKPSKF